MKIGKGMGVLALNRHKKLMARSASMYRRLNERHAKAGQPPMYVRLPHNIITLDAFRESLREALNEGACGYCGELLTVKTISPDHSVPLSRGGGSEWGNIDLICVGCNRAKGSFTKEEFAALRRALMVLASTYPKSNIMGHVLKSLKIANSFRFGSDRRRKESKGMSGE